MFFFTVNIHLEIGQNVPYLLQIFQNEMNRLSFSSSFLINSEQIEQNFNGIMANKYVKIQCWLRNYDKLCENMNTSISFFHSFVMFGQIWKSLVFGDLDLTCLKNNKWLFSFSQIFGEFGLSFEYL